MPSSNASDNSYGGTSKKKVILHLIETAEIEMTPKQISQRTGFNHSTVRKYLRDLASVNKIVQPYTGAYCSKITHGMMFVPLRCHNVILCVVAPYLSFSDDIVEFVGDVKVRVQFGLQRRKLTGRISCDAGMDKNAVLFAIERCLDVMEKRTGRVVEKVVVKTFEVNRDFEKVRLDGSKCFTREGLFGAIERIYQKGDSVRVEHKVSRAMGLEEFEVLLRGGVSGYNLQQAVFALVQENRRLTEAQMFQNEQLMGMAGHLEKLTKLVWKMEQNHRDSS